MPSKGSTSNRVDGFHERPNRGLFAHRNTAASIARIRDALVEFGFEVTSELDVHFGKVSDEYWLEKDHFDRREAAPFIRELAGISVAALSLANQLDAAKPPVRGKLLNALQSVDAHRPQPELLSSLADTLRRLSKVTEPETRGSGKPPSLHVDYAVRSLAQMWVDISGTVFLRSFATARVPEGKEFVSRPALFVQRVARALDPELRLQPVLSALKKGVVKA